MEKLLRQIEGLKTDADNKKTEHEVALKQAKDESNVTIKGLREANERLFEDSERLQAKYDDLVKQKETELKALEETIKKQMSQKINRIKTTFGQSGSNALLKSLDLNELPVCHRETQTEDEFSLTKIRDERIANADTILVPSVVDPLELEGDLQPIEIQFDEILAIDACNSEGALEPRDLIEIEAFEMDERGRSSENGLMRKTARSPEPKAPADDIKFSGKENDEQKSDVKPAYNKSVTYRKM